MDDDVPKVSASKQCNERNCSRNHLHYQFNDTDTLILFTLGTIKKPVRLIEPDSQKLRDQHILYLDIDDKFEYMHLQCFVYRMRDYKLHQML